MIQKMFQKKLQNNKSRDSLPIPHITPTFIPKTKSSKVSLRNSRQSTEITNSQGVTNTHIMSDISLSQYRRNSYIREKLKHPPKMKNINFLYSKKIQSKKKYLLNFAKDEEIPSKMKRHNSELYSINSNNNIQKNETKSEIKFDLNIPSNSEYNVENYEKIKKILYKEYFSKENTYDSQKYNVKIEDFNSEKNSHSTPRLFQQTIKEIIIHTPRARNIPINWKSDHKTPTPDKIIKQNKKKVEIIVSSIYKDIYEFLFDVIHIIPNFIDRNYLNIKGLKQNSFKFLKPLLDLLQKYNISISKEQFMIICSVINENLTFEEKIKFIKEIKTKE